MQREQHGDDHERDRRVHELDGRRAGCPSIEEAVRRRDRGRDQQRDHQQEADGQHHRERPEPAAQQRLQAAALLRHVPHDVERALELGEGAGRAQEQRDHADERGQDARLRLAASSRSCPGRRAPRFADEPLDLRDDLALRRLAPEEEAGDARWRRSAAAPARRACSTRAPRRGAPRCRIAQSLAACLTSAQPLKRGRHLPCRHIRTTARKNERMSGPATRPTGPKVAMPPSRAKKIRPPCTSMRPRIRIGFTMLSEKPTRMAPQSARPSGLGRVARHEQQEGAAEGSRLVAPTAGMNATTKVTAAKKTGCGTPNSR